MDAAEARCAQRIRDAKVVFAVALWFFNLGVICELHLANCANSVGLAALHVGCMALIAGGVLVGWTFWLVGPVPVLAWIAGFVDALVDVVLLFLKKEGR